MDASSGNHRENAVGGLPDDISRVESLAQGMVKNERDYSGAAQSSVSADQANVSI